MTTNKQQLTDNNQSEYARERAAADKLTTNIDPSLTSNTSQPNREITPNNPPPPGHTPQNATTGCTTLLPDTQCTPAEVDPNQQSGMTLGDLPPIRHGESIIEYNERLTPVQSEVFEKYAAQILNNPIESPIGPISDDFERGLAKTAAQAVDLAEKLEPNQQSDSVPVILSPGDFCSPEVRDYFARIQAMKKDPPVTPPPSFGGQNAISAEGAPSTTLPDYQGPYVHIIHDQSACYVLLRDDEGEEFMRNVWVELVDEPNVFELSVPDWRHLINELRIMRDTALVCREALDDARRTNYETQCANLVSENKSLKDELLAMTAQKQQLEADNLRLLSNIDGDNQRIRELREANLALLKSNETRRDENNRLSGENHRLRKALKESTEAMTAGIAKLREMNDAAERIKEILK